MKRHRMLHSGSVANHPVAFPVRTVVCLRCPWCFRGRSRRSLPGSPPGVPTAAPALRHANGRAAIPNRSAFAPGAFTHRPRPNGRSRCPRLLRRSRHRVRIGRILPGRVRDRTVGWTRDRCSYSGAARRICFLLFPSCFLRSRGAIFAAGLRSAGSPRLGRSERKARYAERQNQCRPLHSSTSMDEQAVATPAFIYARFQSTTNSAGSGRSVTGVCSWGVPTWMNATS